MARQNDNSGTAMERAQNIAATAKSTANQKAENAVGEIMRSFDNPKVNEQLVRCTPPDLRMSITPESLLANALMEVKGNKYLQLCTPISVIGSVIRAARLGLIPDGMLGHSYLIPRRVKNVWTCQLQLGYRGIALLCYQSNNIIFRCRVITKFDTYEYEEGLNPVLRHQRCLDRLETPVWDDFRLAYSVATFRDGRTDFRVLTMADLEKARGSSDSFKRNPDQSPWTSWPEAMAEKTCLIKHSKQLPLSTKTTKEILRDERMEIGKLAHTYDMDSRGEVDVGELDSDRGDVIDATATVERPDEPPANGKKPKDCPHPPAAREDDGSCGACGEVLGREPGEGDG